MAKPRFLSVANNERYQHYGDRRNPPWVKLYREFLSDYTLQQLPTDSRLFFACCFILASETANMIPFDVDYLSKRVGFDVTESVITPLIDSGRLLASGASNMLASMKKCSILFSSSSSPLQLTHQSSHLKSKNESSEKDMREFLQFWLAYPRKVGKKEAFKAWVKAKDKPALVDMLKTIEGSKHSDQWTKDNGQFIPHPSTWLNQGRWADVPDALGNGHGKRPPPPPPKNDPIGRGHWGRTYGDPKTHGYD